MPQSAISLLAPAMQKWTADQHWAKLRPIQEKAIPVILRGGSDVIISAATASGKTEAAFLPIGSLLITKPASSLGALCLSPLKALINNQAERLAGISGTRAFPSLPGTATPAGKPNGTFGMSARHSAHHPGIP